MEIFTAKSFDEERALYGVRHVTLNKCRFEGPRDGESALKETEDVRLTDCKLDLRYPLWHTRHAQLEGCAMTENCRAALWYDEDVHISGSVLNGIKALRECDDTFIESSTLSSPEFGWFCRKLRMDKCTLTGEYPFLKSQDLRLSHFTLYGKYSFQYVENMVIENSALHTKDAFWHTKNVTVRDSLVEGEYLGWYSENLHLINCVIRGTQPLCYCRGLVLENCRMEDTDLSFEKSTVQATVQGHIVSVKNPLEGFITADTIGEIVLDQETPCRITTLRE